MKALALLALAAAANAQSPDALYPAAQCAAFWFGRDDYARSSAYLPVEPTDITRAQAYRSAAVHLNDDNAAEIDAFIRDLRPTMTFMFDAYVFGADAQAQDMHDRLTRICAEAAPLYPETKNLP